MNLSSKVRHPNSIVELSLAGRNLPMLDHLSKADGKCIVEIQRPGTTTWEELSRTETIKDDSNPDFTTKINIPYRYGEEQRMKVLVYDMETSKMDSDKHSLIGWVEFTLAEVVANRSIKRRIKYHNPLLERGKLIITAEELRVNKEVVEMQLRAHRIVKSQLRFGKCNPYLVVSKISNGQFVVVYRSEAIGRTRNPVWKFIRIPVGVLCNGDYERPLKIECWDYSRKGNAGLVGHVTTSLNQMINGDGLQWPLIDERKCSDDEYVNSGVLELIYCRIRPFHTFVDYVQGGIEFASMLVIDLSASNLDTDAHLHCSDQGAGLYEQALEVIGSYIEEFDSDSKFQVYGFGACIPPDYVLSHCFNIKLNSPEAECDGMAQVIEAYRSCFVDIQPHGPSFLAPSIRHMIQMIKSTTGSHYYVLWIFTDGNISDMNEAREAIIDASELPLSIIIIGMGDGNFQDMEDLDSDYRPLVSSRGRQVCRDIISFVAFNKFLQGEYGNDAEQSRINFAREVLREVPHQLTSYMMMKRIPPRPPRSGFRLPADPQLL